MGKFVVLPKHRKSCTATYASLRFRLGTLLTHLRSTTLAFLFRIVQPRTISLCNSPIAIPTNPWISVC